MAKLAAIVMALMASEATKPLGEELNAAMGAHADLEVRDFATQFTTAQTAAKDAATQIATLAEQIKAAEPLKARVTELEGTVQKYDGEKRTGLIAAHFNKAATEFGVQPNAVKTAFALVDASKLEVDLAKGTVGGLTKELFESLKPDHPTLFTPTAAPSIPAEKGNAGNANTKPTYTQADFAAGKVDAKDILTGKVELKD